ncbi:M14 family metallopeptidase [Acinetobacter rudis]|uniref:M14 family metallopeptidase n=1 Tax=Acinetobacter rudis TaxID=632955 RepID=UPI00281071BE|nr:M14 family metallopeptidase [Acinetobacter rudis]MDQ8953469.1 M14 family metallopeptidase [Acinetobacter rudis]
MIKSALQNLEILKQRWAEDLSEFFVKKLNHKNNSRAYVDDKHKWYQYSNEEITSLNDKNFLKTTYQFYDELLEVYPEYISMNVLGLDEQLNEIREYIFKPFNIGKMRTSPKSINKFPQILIYAGQHGQECTSQIMLMLFFHELMHKYNEDLFLSRIRSTFQIRIIPCMNPWGVRHTRRRNSNNVDLNRNFPSGWSEAKGSKGKHPLSEKESKVFIMWLERNHSESLCIINIHDHGDPALTWGAASHKWSQELLFKSFQNFSGWYHVNIKKNIGQNTLSWLGQPREGYSDRYVGEEFDLPTILFECPYVNHPLLSAGWECVRITSRQILVEIFNTLLDCNRCEKHI